ncbi:MAG TPA: VWA domain-containing protein [Terracidiphilus sp.]|nr:VWA domain-containing protein [Terracidiphilus sp.]
MRSGLAVAALAVSIGLSLNMDTAALAQNQQSVPDAPTPQAPPPLPGVNGAVTPGEGTGPAAADTTPSSSAVPSSAVPEEPAAPPPPPPVSQQPVPSNNPQDQAPSGGPIANFVVEVNFVEVPVTVKDSKQRQVAGLTWRNFKVYENGNLVHLNFFSVDPQPLSVAFVIDQSLPSNVMDKVNTSMGAIQGALTPYDEAAVFTYSNGPKEWTGFTGAQGNRLPAVLSLAQATGTDPMVPINDGPLAGCSIRQNGNCVDPNLQPGRSAGNGSFITIPKEIHTLNDAILAAAKELSTRPKERRRVIYVISDGKEYGSKATWKEVVKYLQTNKITVYATLVGDSARWGEGWVDRFHLPFSMYDNILYKYTVATGGDTDSEGGINGIEKSYSKIAEEARNQYTLGYLSHESIYDGRYRSIDVRVDRPDLDVIAKRGYYPSAQDYK